jgi:Flp pilus assembly protein TadD
LVLATLGPAVSARAATDEAREIERLFRGGEAVLALQRLDKAVAASPRDARLRFLQGVLLAESRREAEAAAIFTQLSEDFPDLPEPYNNLAVLRAGQGRVDEARALLENALRHDSAYRTAHENLGDVYVLLAQRAYQAAGQGVSPDEALQRKLKLVRELAATRR